MHNTLYYLHPDAGTCAEWLCDDDSVSQLIEASQVLSTCIRTTAILPSDGFYAQLLVGHPWSRWVCDSSYHAQWVFGYYSALCLKFKRIHKREHAAERMRFKLEKLIDIFPLSPFRAPCDDAIMRDYYRHNRTFKDYRHVKRPFWLKRS